MRSWFGDAHSLAAMDVAIDAAIGLDQSVLILDLSPHDGQRLFL